MKLELLRPGDRLQGPSGVLYVVLYVVLAVDEKQVRLKTEFLTEGRGGRFLRADQVALDKFKWKEVA